MRTAVVDIGSNSTRLLIADLKDGRVTTELVQGILRILGNDITRAPEIRRHALDAADNPLLVNEFAGALTVLLNNLDDWHEFHQAVLR